MLVSSQTCFWLLLFDVRVKFLIVAGAQYLQQQGVLANPLNGSEEVALQGNICAFLPSEQHTVLKKKGK